ncbi:ABC transporter ATP-binding protein [Acutalibacter caecimuris]|uniref:ABC transporter ATP-binding protein n=1 Tax=Acutalibacter caecimuris TaxID=3093657 RepID=UPI002AC9C0DB|nr:ABC transporter ATP-binding protein [Acutalibacter sp. M00118]
MSGNILELQNLRAWYIEGKNALSDFSLQLRPHEVVGLIGLNGAGKTTFLKTLSGLHEGFRCDSIRLNGQPSSFRDKGFKLSRYTVFAEDNSFQYFTFREYLSYVAAAYKTKLPDVTELVQGFHFEDYTDMLLKDLSTGNKKKAFLITAFALKPELLLLDEPVNGLDFQSTEYLYQVIAGYKEYGTVLFSSHILESITLTSDRVLVLEDGQIRRSFADDEINAANIREALHDENEL